MADATAAVLAAWPAVAAMAQDLTLLSVEPARPAVAPTVAALAPSAAAGYRLVVATAGHVAALAELIGQLADSAAASRSRTQSKTAGAAGWIASRRPG